MTQQPPRLTARETARCIADLFCLWRCCGKPACRRSRACRGDARACLTALPLVPLDAVCFLKRMDDARGWASFEEMMRESEEEWKAVEEWREIVMSSLPETGAQQEE